MSRGEAVWGKKLGAEGMGTASALDSVGLFPVWPVIACLQISLGLCKKNRSPCSSPPTEPVSGAKTGMYGIDKPSGGCSVNLV